MSNAKTTLPTLEQLDEIKTLIQALAVSTKRTREEMAYLAKFDANAVIAQLQIEIAILAAYDEAVPKDEQERREKASAMPAFGHDLPTCARTIAVEGAPPVMPPPVAAPAVVQPAAAPAPEPAKPEQPPAVPVVDDKTPWEDIPIFYAALVANGKTKMGQLNEAQLEWFRDTYGPKQSKGGTVKLSEADALCIAAAKALLLKMAEKKK